MEKLSALVPRPRAHVTRYHGLFAPHSKARAKIVLGKPKDQTGTAKDESQKNGEEKQKSESRMSWAKLLNRVFKVDVTHCQFCRGEVKVVAAIMERKTIEKILNHLGLPTDPPTIHPARPPPQAEFDGFSQIQRSDFSDF